MGTIYVITWNMQGLTRGGKSELKIQLICNMIQDIVGKKGPLPIFLLQEVGDLEHAMPEFLKKNPTPPYSLLQHYTGYFCGPLVSKNKRCTTGILFPQPITAHPAYDPTSQDSGVRAYVSAYVTLGGKDAILASIHAEASGAAADGVRMLNEIHSKSDFFLAGGDFNCSPDDMQPKHSHTGHEYIDYQVWQSPKPTHVSPDGPESHLDYICTKGFAATDIKRLSRSLSPGSEPLSDHYPVQYELTY